MREIELSEAAGLAAWRAQGLRKGAGHKYIRRVPKPGGGYRYYYRTAGVTRGVGADLVPGAKFKLTHEGQPGHFEVVRRAGDRVVLKHDESGASMTVSAEALGDLLKREHASVVNTAKERLKRDIEAARKHGSPKQIARLEAQARRFGFEGLTEGADGGAGAMFTPVTDPRTSTHHDASADKSEDPVVLEYATRFLFKGKSPKVAAALTESKLSGQDNLFLGKVFINAASLEMALWRKLVEFSDEPSSVVEKFNLRKGSARQLVAYMADKHGWSNSETVEHLRRLDRIYGWDLASRPLPRIPNSRNRASKG
ncbi:MAG: hypothetical protein KC613_06935 [Myxococcales bacterium]|nr:hypothetical protein [Myxococcales bacterium]